MHNGGELPALLCFLMFACDVSYGDIITFHHCGCWVVEHISTGIHGSLSKGQCFSQDYHFLIMQSCASPFFCSVLQCKHPFVWKSLLFVVCCHFLVKKLTSKAKQTREPIRGNWWDQTNRSEKVDR